MRPFIFLLAGIFTHLQVQAQIHIEGVTTELGKVALPYVNIGIRHKNIGTVSSATGAFSINIPRQNAGDTLTFSMVGYEEINIRIADINTRQKEFVLKPANVRLSEFTVSAKRLVEKKYGLYKYHPILHFLDASVDQSDIFEIGQLINLGHSSAKITSVNLHINEPRKDSGTFRINFYKYNGSRPGIG